MVGIRQGVEIPMLTWACSTHVLVVPSGLLMVLRQRLARLEERAERDRDRDGLTLALRPATRGR